MRTYPPCWVFKACSYTFDNKRKRECHLNLHPIYLQAFLDGTRPQVTHNACGWYLGTSLHVTSTTLDDELLSLTEALFFLCTWEQTIVHVEHIVVAPNQLFWFMRIVLCFMAMTDVVGRTRMQRIRKNAQTLYPFTPAGRQNIQPNTNQTFSMVMLTFKVHSLVLAKQNHLTA